MLHPTISYIFKNLIPCEAVDLPESVMGHMGANNIG